MNLLAGGISRVNAIVIVILCILICLFVLVNVILVISLHRQNKKLAKKEELLAPDEQLDKN